jgi:hypothetical protein
MRNISKSIPKGKYFMADHGLYAIHAPEARTRELNIAFLKQLAGEITNYSPDHNINHEFTRYRIVPVNHFRRLKRALQREGMKGVLNYVFLLINSYRQVMDIRSTDENGNPTFKSEVRIPKNIYDYYSNLLALIPHGVLPYHKSGDANTLLEG